MAKTQRICSMPGCNNPFRSRGWCNNHYKRWLKFGNPLGGKWHYKVCSVEGCDDPHLALGYCNKHWKRYQIHGDPLGGRETVDIWKYYHETVLPYEGDECLFWPYSKVQKRGEHGMVISRMVCEDANGPPPNPELMAAHSCGNGHLKCVNKRHLRWATAKENASDRILHGTIGVKLNEDKVRAIKSLKDKLAAKELATRFGVSTATIYLIKRERLWAWVE